MVIEDVQATGVIDDENTELQERFADYAMPELKRISFWRATCNAAANMPSLHDKDFVGYAILKRDSLPSNSFDRWHVFEAVMPKFEHDHNCVPRSGVYKVMVGDRYRMAAGVLYCQQNGLNKACAHVALRSLVALHHPDTLLAYSEINRIAVRADGPTNPAQGLSVQQIEKILTEYGIGFRDVDYSEMSLPERRKLPYQKFLYAGIESGAGAMLGFRFTGPKARNEHHIIPFFGHTFNQDAWVSEADAGYFRVGERTRYTPSEAWCSSFIGHDDNFGPNFCVPRLYVTPRQAQYVVELLLPRITYSGVIAEAAAVDYLYSILRQIKDFSNPWMTRLWQYTQSQKVVLRAVSLSKAQYIVHLRENQDWNGNKEIPALCDVMEELVPQAVWLVEVSLPQLFPANQRKLGEIVLNATRTPTSKRDYGTFVCARLPELILLLKRTVKGQPQFLTGPSGITSHVPVFKRE